MGAHALKKENKNTKTQKQKVNNGTSGCHYASYLDFLSLSLDKTMYRTGNGESVVIVRKDRKTYWAKNGRAFAERYLQSFVDASLKTITYKWKCHTQFFHFFFIPEIKSWSLGRGRQILDFHIVSNSFIFFDINPFRRKQMQSRNILLCSQSCTFFELRSKSKIAISTLYHLDINRPKEPSPVWYELRTILLDTCLVSYVCWEIHASPMVGRGR